MRRNGKIVILFQNKHYERDLPADKHPLLIGTEADADICLHACNECGNFRFTVKYENHEWVLSCGNDLSVTTDDGFSDSCSLSMHGETVVVESRSHKEVLRVSLAIGFSSTASWFDRMISIDNSKSLIIGNTQDSSIVIPNLLHPAEAELMAEKGKYRLLVRDGNISRNGVKIEADTDLKECDFFGVEDVLFYLRRNRLHTYAHRTEVQKGTHYVDLINQRSNLEYPKFNRNTRLQSVIKKEKIEILDPPAKPEKPKTDWLMRLIPAVAMIAIVIILRSSFSNNSTYILFSVSSMSLGIIITVLTSIRDAKAFKGKLAQRESKYKSYVGRMREQIDAARTEEKNILAGRYLRSDQEIGMILNFSGDLFDRVEKDADFLHVRLGTGKREAERKIEYRKNHRLETDDELFNIPMNLENEYRYIDDAPIWTDFSKANAIGVVGSGRQLHEMLKIMTLDICARQFHKDVRLIYMMGEQYANSVSWARIIPHVQTPEMKTRAIICDEESSTAYLEYLYAEFSAREAAKRNMPRQIVFVFDPMSLKRHPASKYLSRASELGFTFVYFVQYKELLSQYCQDIIVLDDVEDKGIITRSDDMCAQSEFRFEPVRDAQMNLIAIRLAPVYSEEINLQGSLAKNLSFYAMMNIGSADELNLQKRWAQARTASTLAAPIGVRAQGTVVELDLHERAHGPHGLVAGTTGSGKSEILQTYVLSMATRYSPVEVGFVIIDFKGGGMSEQFSRLPHLLGSVTNIDGAQITRSLKFIRAERVRRLTIFNEYKINHIDKYISLYKRGIAKIPIPHLIIIVDEFAQLKAEQPEFMEELINASRIGRSLGIHLILATQKPSGVVDAQIWANSNFRLCLKVQSKQDSSDMLHSPVAAEIAEPGRAYFQVGNNEIFELLQSGYSGCAIEMEGSKRQSDFTLYTLSTWGKRSLIYQRFIKKEQNEPQSEAKGFPATQFQAVVNHVADYCASHAVKIPDDIILPSLKNNLIMPGVQGSFDLEQVPAGIYDDPDNQLQNVVHLDLASENTLIVGTVQMGKTTLLQTLICQIARAFSPADAVFYIADFSSESLRIFSGLCHVGGIIVSSDEDGFASLMKLLIQEIHTRKSIFNEAGFSSFSTYKESGKKRLPQIFFILENFAVYKELYEDKYESDMLYLIREGIAYGISTIMTSQQSNVIGYRYLSNFKSRIAFYCNEKSEYGSLYDRVLIMPEDIPGRAVFLRDNRQLLFQSYIAFGRESVAAVSDQFKDFIDRVNGNNPGMRAKEIPCVPKVLSTGYIKRNYPELHPGEFIGFAMDYATIELLKINVYEQFVLGLTGKNAKERMLFLNILFSDVQANIFERPAQVYIVDDYKRSMRSWEAFPFVEKYSISAEAVLEVFDDVAQKLEERYELLQDHGPEALESKPWLIVFINNKLCYDILGASREHNKICADINKKFRSMKILILLSDLDNAAISSMACELLKGFKSDKKLLYFGNLREIKIFDVYNSTINSLGMLQSNDDAYYLCGEEIYRVKTISEV